MLTKHVDKMKETQHREREKGEELLVEHRNFCNFPILSQQSFDEKRAVHLVRTFSKMLSESNKVVSIGKKPWHIDHFESNLVEH